MSRKKIRSKLIAVFALIFFMGISAYAYEMVNIYEQNEEIGTNLDLDAVASLFGESEDLEDLERRLNDPYMKISNLDLNDDGYVDYLRLIEVNRGYTHLIVIQAVIGPDLYQDIATIEVSRSSYGDTSVQIVGNSYIYGTNYIVEPIYTYTPVIYNYFWGARYYRPYYSHYRWGHYPHRYRPWRPLPVHHYSKYIHRHINKANRYRYTTIRRSRHAREMHRSIRRDDYINIYRGQMQRHHNGLSKRAPKSAKGEKRYRPERYHQISNKAKRDKYSHMRHSIDRQQYGSLHRRSYGTKPASDARRVQYSNKIINRNIHNRQIHPRGEAGKRGHNQHTVQAKSRQKSVHRRENTGRNTAHTPNTKIYNSHFQRMIEERMR